MAGHSFGNFSCNKPYQCLRKGVLPVPPAATLPTLITGTSHGQCALSLHQSGDCAKRRLCQSEEVAFNKNSSCGWSIVEKHFQDKAIKTFVIVGNKLFSASYFVIAFRVTFTNIFCYARYFLASSRYSSRFVGSISCGVCGFDCWRRGLVQVPALLFLPQFPVPAVIGTNRFASVMGTSVAAVQYARSVPIPWRTVLVAGIGQR